MKKTARPFTLLLAIATLFLPARGVATEEYAKRTGKSCEACHVNPAGGGELSPAGEAFRKDLLAGGETPPHGSVRRAVRFIAGFLHLFIAILWFGTILYVHLLLKPAYAARGLPRGELIVGWSSIVLIALTGGILTIFRVPSLDVLFHTRFGILLTLKVAVYLVMVATAVIVTFVVGPKLKKRQQKIDLQKKDMTPEELSPFDGKEGRPAYIGYQGKVYDVTARKLWEGGNHVGKHLAGSDLTDALSQAPHGDDRVFALPTVGRLVGTGERKEMPLHEKGFYFMTYLNLGLVLIIIVIISLWRWW